MQTILILIYYTVIVLATLVGTVKYKQLDKALRSIAILLMLTVLSESLSFVFMELEQYSFRNGTYHIYGIAQLILLSLFFIYAIRPDNYQRYIVAAFIGSVVIGILNMVFLQPIYRLNTHMLMFESFAMITISLYYVYWLIRRGTIVNMIMQPHFIIAILLLLLWSSSFFFWAFISALYEDGWAYITAVTNTHIVVNIIVYSGIGLTLFYSTRKIFKYDYQH